MIRSFALGLVAAAVLALPASAATWVVDKAHSKLGFRGTVEDQPFDGQFRRWDAQISFDPKSPATSKAVVTIDTGSAFTNDKDRDESLPGDEWFAVKAFPRATFTTTKFVDLGGGKWQAVGDLVIKGVKRPVVLPFTLAINGDVAKMSGAMVLDRTAFNVGSGRWKSADEVGTKVTVQVDLTARKAR
jgi:polyisoprenoid-binding protein YceI